MSDSEKSKPAPAKKAVVKKASVKKSTSVQDKQAADTDRRTGAVEAGQANKPEPSEAQAAEEKRRDGIRRSLEQNQETMDSLEADIDNLREQSAKLLLTLYPQQGPNDPHHIAVKGFLEASRKERATRASNPAKLAALIAQMHKSPIDAAMTRATKRGTRRPDRPMKSAGSGAG